MTRTRNTHKNLAAPPVAALLLVAIFLWSAAPASAMQILESRRPRGTGSRDIGPGGEPDRAGGRPGSRG